jgi:hypothetical protein
MILNVSSVKFGDLECGKPSHPLKSIVAVLDVLRKLDRRKLPVEPRDDDHISSAAYGSAEVVFCI